MNQRRAAVFLPLFLIFLTCFSRLIGCSTQTDESGLLAIDGGTTINTATLYCSTPAQGCACGTPGATAACGRVEVTTDGFKQCSYGTFTCSASGQWGACEGEVRVQSLISSPGGRVKAQAEQLDASECGDADPCDPYCNGYTDNPTGISPLPSGFTVVDSGLTIVAVDAGTLPGTVETTGDGNSTCGAALNVHGGACNGAPITACQQDFRCDQVSNTCVWNGGEGYHDPYVMGVDLTLGTACGYEGVTTFPLCNRGSATVPAGTALGINYVAGTTQPDGCATIGAPTCSTIAPTGGLAPGACLNVPCNIGTTGGFAVVNAGNRDVTESSGYCGNNVAFAQTTETVDAGDASSTTTVCAACTYCDTTVTGVVNDPGDNVGLRDVTVYELAGASGNVPAIPDNTGGTTPPPCDTCDSLLPPTTYSVAVNTDVTGSFTLRDVTPGPNQKIVAQTGRWRRAATVNIQACQPNSIDMDTIRLPRSHTEGDIPKIAMVMGAAESLECWLLKMGIDSSEMTSFTGTSDTARIQLFSEGYNSGPNHYGLTEGSHDGYSAKTPPYGDGNLWGTGGAINEYSAVLFSCSGSKLPETNDYVTSLVNYANAGGRVFMDHFWGETWIQDNGSPWGVTAVSTWANDSDPPPPAAGKVMNTTTAQQHMYDWLGQWAPYNWAPGTGVGWLESDEPRYDAIKQGSASQVWVRGQDSNDWKHNPSGDYTLSFSFETPISADTTCGRVLFNDMHASNTRSPTTSSGDVYGAFPGSCNTGPALTSEEKALEYQLFQLTACALGGSPPPPPPPPPPTLASATFSRDFYATCPDGYQLVWQAFNWEANIPAGTSIQLYAATSQDEGTLPANVSAAPLTVPIGDATMTTLAPQWGTDVHTVDWHLQNEPPGPPQQSESWLRVYMSFDPTSSTAPTMYDWQQLYDCVPNQ